MRKKIIFYGPTGTGLPDNLLGGGEKGCRRTIAIYEKHGIDVDVVEKPVLGKGKCFFLVSVLKLPWRIVLTLLKQSKSPVHIVGFYENQLLIEFLVFCVSKLFRRRIVYELRNGTMVKTFNSHSFIYRWGMKRIIKSADAVLCQGLEYVDFINKQWCTESIYYPNYVMSSHIKPYQERTHNQINMIYFGRVAESKNVEVIIKVLGILLCKKVNATLCIIGGTTDSYKKNLERCVFDEHIPSDRIVIYGASPFSFIADNLSKSHYFVFPSSEPKEGHSNSLTEAMAYGVVPIVSKAGFNETICGTMELVVNEVSPQLFAEKILEIETSGRWKELSDFVYKRFCSNYTEDVAIEKIQSVLEKLGLN